MGCLSSTDAKNDFEANEEFDDEEKEMKPTHKMTDDADMGIPDEMNVNRLKSNNVSQPLKSSNNNSNPQYPQSRNNPNIGGTNNRRGGQVNTNQASVLNNFSGNAAKNYDVNQYNPASPNSDLASTASKDSSMNQIPEHRMMDSHGNVHVNKFYNVTRNHNLSNASKLTDMSEMPSVAHMQQGPHAGVDSNDNLSMAGYQHMQNLSVANNGLSPVHGHGAHHKMSIDSATTNGSKMLWDDFSERGSVMTENTSTV